MRHYQLKLFVTGRTPRSETAIRSLRQVCEHHLRGEYDLDVVDVLERPQVAEEEKILATPTLIRLWPLPVRRVVGDLSQTQHVLWSLDLGGDDGASASASPA